MARRRSRAVAQAGGVPPEFLDVAHDVWHNMRTFTIWAAENGIDPEPILQRVKTEKQWCDRAWCDFVRSEALEAWAIPNGFQHERWSGLDLGKLTAAGVPHPRTFSPRCRH